MKAYIMDFFSTESDLYIYIFFYEKNKTKSTLVYTKLTYVKEVVKTKV